MRRATLTAVAIAALLVGYLGAGMTAQDTPSSGPALMLSGTVRWVNSTTWAAVDDSGHTPTGIDHVELKPDRLRVHYTFTASKVSSLQATPDEQFTAAGVRVGASVGYTYTDLFFYMGTSQTPVNPALLSRAGANVWLTGFFHVDEIYP